MIGDRNKCYVDGHEKEDVPWLVSVNLTLNGYQFNSLALGSSSEQVIESAEWLVTVLEELIEYEKDYLSE